MCILKFFFPHSFLLFSFLVAFFFIGCATTEEKLNRQLLMEKKYFRGIAYLEKNNLALARKEFLGAMEIDPSVSKVHNALGRVYLAENKDDLSEKEFKRAIELNDLFYEAYIYLGTLYMKQRKFAQAIVSFKKLLEFSAAYPEYRTYNHLGGVYYESEDFDQAFESLRKSISAKPGYMSARYNMGLVLYILGYENKAIKEFSMALELSPKFPLAHNQLGLIYMKRKMYRKALPEFQAVVSESRDNYLKESAKEYIKIIKKIKGE